MASRYEEDDREQSPAGSSWDDDAAAETRWNPAAFEADAGNTPDYEATFEDDEEAYERVGVEDPAQMAYEAPYRAARGGGGRRGSPLTWIAGAAVLVVIILALVWGSTGIGRQEPTPTPTPTEASVFQAPDTPTPLPPLAIEPTTAVTATPAPTGSITVGSRVQVVNSAPQGISLRAGAGLSYVRLTTLTDGTQLTVLDPPSGFADAYPSVVDNFTWWRVRTPDGTVGWVASAWLQPAN